MATRVYLLNAAADISPSNWASGWGTPVTGNVTKKASKLKASTSFATVAAASGNVVATLPFMRFLLGPLTAQTISGTIKGQMRGQESNAASQNTHAIGVRLLASDGSQRSVLLAPAYADLVDNAAYELATSLTNMKFYNTSESASISLTSQTATAGDYLEITIGSRKNAAVTSRTITLEYGDNSSSDLPEDTSTTSQYCPWVEFSGAITIGASLSLAGGLTPSSGLVRESRKGAAGGATPAGALVKQLQRLLSAGNTPAATLGTEKQVAGPKTQDLAGGLTPTGAAAAYRRLTALFGGDL